MRRMLSCYNDVYGKGIDGMPRSIEQAIHHLNHDKLVIFPTETVYGLGGAARSDIAVQAIYDAKKRPTHNPLILHVASPNIAQYYAVWSELAFLCAKHFMPGPLTLILPKLPQPTKPLSTIHSQHDSVAIRIPYHPVAQELLQHFGEAIAAPSANMSGYISATRPHHMVTLQQHASIACLLDGAVPDIGIESTILSLCHGTTPTILREGIITQAILQATLGCDVVSKQATDDSAIRAPGMLKSHYAPHKKLELNVEVASESMYLIGFNRVKGDCNLSVSGNLLEATMHLYDYLHQADMSKADKIGIAPIPHEGIGIALNDRLQRAAYRKDTE